MTQNARNSPSDTDPILIVMGSKIRARREREGLSLRKFSDMVGVDRTVLNSIELGRGNPTIKTLIKIADGLGVNVAYFLSDESLIVEASCNE